MDIIFKDVSYWYAKGTPFEKQALDQVSVVIPSGQFVAIMGKTGSGKTTLAQMINGLIRPTQGEVLVGSYRLTQKKEDLRKLRASIGYAFQYPEHQLFEETIFKDISFSLKQLEYPEELIPSRVKKAMELVGLPYEEFKDRSPFQLSGGQMRRVALAGVLVIQPKILILDEPTAGLDPLGRLELLTLIRKLHQEEGMTIVYITHRLEEALEYSERILVMSEGRLSADLVPSQVPQKLHELIQYGLMSTPMLRFIEKINQHHPGLIPSEVVREDQFIPYLLKALKGGEGPWNS